MIEKFKTLFFVKSSLITLYLALTIPIPFISIDHAIITLLKRNNMRRYFAIPLTKKILKILLRILPIQTTPWDSFSIKKYDFNHVPITNPETFKLKSYAKSLNDILRLSKLPSCNNN